MEKLTDDAFLKVLCLLDDDSLWNLLQIFTKQTARALEQSPKLLKKFKLKIDPEKFALLRQGGELSEVQFRNVSITNFKKKSNELRSFLVIIKNFKKSIEILIIEEFKERSAKSLIDFFKKFKNLKSLELKNCFIQEEVDRDVLNDLPNLKDISFEKCCENLFKLFKRQTSIEKITIKNNDFTWNGFSHEGFNDMVKTLPNFCFLVFEGTGTGSYFDCDDFPFFIKKLNTTLITFHWYVGIRTARVNFLKKQLGHINELTIHKLPYDFDGGRVLKFIIEEMRLEKFYYENIPLILNSVKQDVYEFEANEIQICALFEMFIQFPTIKKFTLRLTQTDVDSSEIERIINPLTDVFLNAEILVVIDESGYRQMLGLFLGLFKNFRRIKTLKIYSPDRNINVLLQEFLPRMTSLTEIYIDSKAPRVEIRFNTIRANVPELKKLWVDPEYVEQARTIFGTEVNVYETERLN